MPLNLSAIGQKIGPITSAYDWRDVVLYALGVGAGFDELEYVYENKLKVIPSFAVICARPITTLRMADEDFLALIGGRLPAMQAFTTSKLRIEGDLMKSQLIEKLFRF
jgi:putative sterol carrier protein